MKKLTRYNSNLQISSNLQFGNNNIFKYLKNEIDFLLAPSADQLNEVDFDDIYIPNPQAEKFLSSALTYSKSDKVLYLTGLTGSGKSMVLKKVFNYQGMAPVIHDKTLIIPFSFDNFLENTSNSNIVQNGINTVFINMLTSACELIEKTYPYLETVSNNEESFLYTVGNSRADYTQIPNAWPRPTTKERIEYFIKYNPIPFNTSILKYYLNQKECSINNIVILIDDIEGAGEIKNWIQLRWHIVLLLASRIRPKPSIGLCT